MAPTFAVVDLFAGPGGLGEGFCAFEADGRRPFRIGISIEKEASAHRTLRLRAFLRACEARTGGVPDEFVRFHAGRSPEPDWAEVDPASWEEAEVEARCLELGTDEAAEAISSATARLRSGFDDTVLIGGPPCQAYSLVGRARSRGNAGYVPEEDQRHYLFREYIRVLRHLRPAAFVMENVKGMLSSTVESRRVFEMLLEDLASLGTGRAHHYELMAIGISEGEARLVRPARPSDFVVHSEALGVPQRRHRVIIVGLRSDVAGGAHGARITLPPASRTVEQTIGHMPRLRSGISRRHDDAESWRAEVADHARLLARIFSGTSDRELGREFLDVADMVDAGGVACRNSRQLPGAYGTSSDPLLRWIERPGLAALAQHETRSHIGADLGRYLFASVFARVRGHSPKAPDFPMLLTPDHRNWNSGTFSDRFRVQLAREPSTTITSHISKDGHYYIHPDPLQCRSLTVREAARLQTFPDDYLFLGNRTQQYVQVGNAVPPFLAKQIAELLHRALARA